jgi:multimeric flavodoxin WrbA
VELSLEGGGLIMKKVTAFIGTESKKATYQAVKEFEKNLKRYGEIDFEYVFLNDYRLEFCRGCKVCFNRGEEYCPLKDDRDVLLKKMDQSDGVIFATPNYAFQVSARMKNLLDRLAFVHHRPRFFGKTCTTIVVQGFRGGEGILKYLNSTADSMGFRVSEGCCATTLDPMTGLQQKRLARKVSQAASGFYRDLMRPIASPSLYKLMLFRFVRTFVKSVDQDFRDYGYYKEKGWFESDYFYSTSLGPVKKLAGNLFDLVGRRMSKVMGGEA